MDRPRILVDRDIPWGIEAFAGLGDVVEFDAAGLRDDPSPLAGADVLACRSATRIDASLLAAAPRLRAVATPVIGLDHVRFADVREAEARRGHPIAVFAAPGSTAAGVADWVVAALLEVLPDREPRDLRVGIWGFGCCGRALAARLDRLGIPWVAHDPPLEARTAGAFASAPREALWGCDAVTLHVPLTGPDDSPWPTRGMVDGAVLQALRDGGDRLLCNTSRGAVIRAAALRECLASGAGPGIALDVYEGEPAPDPEFLARPRIATAHVAGSVLEGRRRAVARVREDVRRLLHLPRTPFPAVPPGGFDRPVPFVVPASPSLPRVRDGILRAVPLAAWTRDLREACVDVPQAACGRGFERVRKGGLRREIRWLGMPRMH